MNPYGARLVSQLTRQRKKKKRMDAKPYYETASFPKASEDRFKMHKAPKMHSVPGKHSAPKGKGKNDRGPELFAKPATPCWHGTPIILMFDGGTPCNDPRAYGEGYGSFQFHGGPIHRVNHGRPMSNNGAELWTLHAAAAHLAREWVPGEVSIKVIGDSQIALKWARVCFENCKAKLSKSSSEEMVKAIAALREILPRFASVETEWRARAHSVAVFGH